MCWLCLLKQIIISCTVIEYLLVTLGGPIGGGGMLFVGPGGGPRPTPGFGPNMGIPGGSLPEGARFDPFRPPDVDRFHPRPRRPDNDEFPPPGFDDMYM